jgi:phosphatidylglycerophosphate synthase
MNVVSIPSSSPAFRDAARIQTSVLSDLERRALVWIAHRLPRAVTSDHLTALALAGMAMVGLSYWLASVSPAGLVLAVAGLAVNWFGDSLDGTVARVRQHQRPRYGYYVDHVVDALGAVLLFAGLGLSGYMSAPVAGGLLVAYLLVCIEVYLATHSLGRFQMSFFGMGPTELRLVLAAGSLVLLVHPDAVLFGRVFRLFDVGGLAGAAGLLATFVVSAARNTRALYRAEPVPLRRAS